MDSLNIASLLKHIDELRVLMSDQTLDVLAVNETRLDDTVSNQMIHIDGYDIVRRDRNRRGGGVCLYIRGTFNYTRRHDVVDVDIEAVCVEINRHNSKPFAIISAYRPPNAEDEFFSLLELIIQKLDGEGKEILIMGDLNCDLLSKSLERHCRHLLSLCEVYQFSQLIEQPARITETTQTLIDVILTNNPSRIVSSGVIQLGISDHNLVYAIRKIAIPTKNNHKFKSTRQMKYFKGDDFRNDLKEQPWDKINLCDDPNSMWDEWKKMFLKVAHKHAPLKKKRVRNKASPWITFSVKKLLHKNALQSRAVKFNSTKLWEEYKKARNETNNAIKKAKSNYYQNHIDSQKANPAEIWKTINTLMSRKTKNTGINELNIDDRKCTSPKEISEELNLFFSEIGPKLASNLSDSSVHLTHFATKVNSSFRLSETDNDTVLKHLKGLKIVKAVGLDDVSSNLLKEAAPAVASSVCKIFNKPISTSIFPNEWKIAKVFLIHKVTLTLKRYGFETNTLNWFNSYLHSITKMLC